jgi:L-alanine-DL-glutamate epimerase-like enolase superfamily enzyme
MEHERTTTKRTYRCITPTIAAWIFLLAVPIISTPTAGQTPVSAGELLAAFSGNTTTQYEPFFQFSEDRKIVTVEIHAVGNHDTTARYSGREHAWHEVNNILRITTADGYEGVSGVDAYYKGTFSDELLLELEGVASDLLALESLDPVHVGTMLQRMRPSLSDAARSSIDIALWDLAARRADLPLYRLLGRKRDSMVPYASFPYYESLPEYIEAVEAAASLGYTTFKFHAWGHLKEDLRLVELVQRRFADSAYRFMIDFESAYGLADALKLGERMDEGLFIWFEAPVDDKLLEQYAELKKKLAVSIIPAGYNIYSPAFIREGIKTDAWDAARFDATVVGGITQALWLLMITNEADLPVEIQSWGYSLTQAANLHLMLANERTQFFEAPMPKAAFEFGMKNGNLLDRGRVFAPEGPGLGLEVDWDRLTQADFYRSSAPVSSGYQR